MLNGMDDRRDLKGEDDRLFPANEWPDDDFLDPEQATALLSHQLNTQALIERCKGEIDQSLAAASKSYREEDLVSWLAEELRREYLEGYLGGLERLDSVIGNLTEGTAVSVPLGFADDARSREGYRQRAVDRVARINEELLRRQLQKDERGSEN